MVVPALAAALGCGKTSQRAGDGGDVDPDLGAAGRLAGTGGGTAGGGTAAGGASTGSGGKQGSGAAGSGGKQTSGAGGVGLAGSGGANEGGIGGLSMVPVQGCVVDASGTCVEPPDLVANIRGCEKLQLLVRGEALYILSSATRQLFRLMDALPTLATVPGGLSDGVTAGLPTAFALDSGYAYVAVGQALLRVDLESALIAVVAREPETIADVTVVEGRLYYAHGGAVSYVPKDGFDASGAAITTGLAGPSPKSMAATAGSIVWGNLGSASIESLSPALGEFHVVAPSQGGLILGHRALQVDRQNVFWMNFNLKRATVTGAPTDVGDVVIPAGGDLVAFALGSPPDEIAAQAYLATTNGTIEVGAISDPIVDGPNPATGLARDMGSVTSMAVDSGRVFVATTDCNVTAILRPTPPP